MTNFEAKIVQDIASNKIAIILIVVLILVIVLYFVLKKKEEKPLNPNKPVTDSTKWYESKETTDQKNFIKISFLLDPSHYTNQKKYKINIKNTALFNKQIERVADEMDNTFYNSLDNVLTILNKYAIAGEYQLPHFAYQYQKKTGRNLKSDLLYNFTKASLIEKIYTMLYDAHKTYNKFPTL